jgi:hypothetical protein
MTNLLWIGIGLVIAEVEEVEATVEVTVEAAAVVVALVRARALVTVEVTAEATVTAEGVFHSLNFDIIWIFNFNTFFASLQRVLYQLVPQKIK